MSIGRTKTTLVDSTNVAAATNYYPDSTGIDMSSIDKISVLFETTGGVTVTFEENSHAAGSDTWVDITKAGYSRNTNTTNATSFVDKVDCVDFDGIRAARFRIKSVTADATNTVKIKTITDGIDGVVSS